MLLLSRSGRWVWLSFLSVSTALAAAACSPLAAAEKPAKAELPIAILNLDRLSQGYEPLNDRLAALKADVAKLDRTAKLRQVELETVQNQLRGAKAGTAEFERLRLQQAKLQTELQLFIEREKQEVQKKESAIYLDFYRQVEAEVAEFCQPRGIKLVLRQQKSEAKTSDSPQEIIKLISRPVVYQDGLDITDAILKALADDDQDRDK